MTVFWSKRSVLTNINIYDFSEAKSIRKPSPYIYNNVCVPPNQASHVPRTKPLTAAFSSKKSKKYLPVAMKTPSKTAPSARFSLKNHPKT